MWEYSRYEWPKLRASGSAETVPRAIEALRESTSAIDAERAYWRIDNTVIVQGALYEAAVPTVTCLVVALNSCTAVSRQKILELLAQLGDGESDPSEAAIGNGDLRGQCVRELLRGVPVYLDLLEHGSDEERIDCVDLVGICGRYDASLRPRVEWYLRRLLDEQLSDGLRTLVHDCLRQDADA